MLAKHHSTTELHTQPFSVFNEKIPYWEPSHMNIKKSSNHLSANPLMLGPFSMTLVLDPWATLRIIPLLESKARCFKVTWLSLLLLSLLYNGRALAHKSQVKDASTPIVLQMQGRGT